MDDAVRQPPVAPSVLVLILIWGTTYAAIRVGLESVPPFMGISLRFSIAAAALLVGARVLGVEWRRDGNRWGLWAFNALTHFVVPYSVVYWSEQWLPSGLAAVLFSTFPLLVALLAHWMVPGERLGRLAVAGILVGMAGVAVIYSDDLGSIADPQVRLAAWVFMLAPITSALGDVVIKRRFSQVHPISLTAPSLVMTAVVTGGMAWVFEDWQAARLDARAWSVILYLALAGTAFTFILYFRLLSRLRVTGLSLITFGIPIVALAVGTLWLDEILTPKMILGALLVLSGVWAALRQR